jgi:hypothetical protein
VEMNERLVAAQQVGPAANAYAEFQKAGAWQY